MKKQSNRRTAQLIKQFPAVGVILAGSEFRDFNVKDRTYKLPDTYIHVQRSDPETMHLKGNICDGHRSYITNEKSKLRGTKTEFLIAINHNEKEIAQLDWFDNFNESGCLIQKSAQDIFKSANPDDVKYLIWIERVVWYEPAPENSDWCIKDPFLGQELRIYVFLPHKDLSWAQLIELANNIKKDREEAWKYPPTPRLTMNGIEAALRNGCKIHAFSSGGGLRVIGIKKNAGYIGYGEHPHVEEALLHADEDYLVGGRPYKEVYGKKYPHYLTGSTECTSNLDFWLRRGSTFDVWADGSEIVFRLNGFKQTEFPKELDDKVLATGKPETFEDRGYTYRLTRMYLANGKPGVSGKVIKSPKGKRLNSDPWMYHITKTARDNNFWDAMLKAFEAPEIEVAEKE